MEAMMTSASDFTAGGLAERFVHWLRPRVDLREICKLSDTDIASIANNLRIPRSELETLAAHGQGAKELARLLNELGIDEAAVIRKEPGIMRDMRMICALCVAKLRCGRELDDGTATRTFNKYCSNNQTIRALRMAPKNKAD
jgi:hypothetical protein